MKAKNLLIRLILPLSALSLAIFIQFRRFEINADTFWNMRLFVLFLTFYLLLVITKVFYVSIVRRTLQIEKNVVVKYDLLTYLPLLMFFFYPLLSWVDNPLKFRFLGLLVFGLVFILKIGVIEFRYNKHASSGSIPVLTILVYGLIYAAAVPALIVFAGLASEHLYFKGLDGLHERLIQIGRETRPSKILRPGQTYTAALNANEGSRVELFYAMQHPVKGGEATFELKRYDEAIPERLAPLAKEWKRLVFDIKNPQKMVVNLTISDFRPKRVKDKIHSFWRYLGKPIWRWTCPESRGVPFLLFTEPRILGKSRDQYNVILISLDTLRADHLTNYGYPLNTSPFIKELADEGVMFSNTVSTSSWTLPTHASMFTSVLPSFHKALSFDLAIDSKAHMVTEQFGRAGYNTAAFTDGYAVAAKFGFARGFDVYYENLWPVDLHLLPQEYHKNCANTTFGKAREWIASHQDSPFFMFLHTFEIHNPYWPEGEYAEMFVEEKRPDFLGFRDRHRILLYGGLAYQKLPEQFDADDTRFMISQYDGEIAYTDSELRALVTELKEMGILDRTLIVITSDHGEAFKEHGVFGHGVNLYNETLEVPLIFWNPGLIPQGRKIDTHVSLLDIAPTILDVLGFEEMKSAQGISLYPLMTQKGPDQGKEIRSRKFISELSTHMPANSHAMISLQDEEFKIIYSLFSGEYEFYNLREDEEESIDLSQEDMEEFEIYKEHLNSYLELMEKVKEEDPGEALQHDQDFINRMKALGYLN